MQDKVSPVDSAKFISSSLTSVFSANKETNRQSSSGRKVSQAVQLVPFLNYFSKLAMSPVRRIGKLATENAQVDREATQLGAFGKKGKKHIT